MRSINPTLALGFAALVFGVGACSDPVTLHDGITATEPLQVMDVIVHNGMSAPVDVALETGDAALALGNIPPGRQLRYQVDVRALGGGGVGRLLATDGGPWVMRSDPIWIEADRALDFTVSSGGIVWKRATDALY